MAAGTKEGYPPAAEETQVARCCAGFTSLQYELRFLRRIKSITMPVLASRMPEIIAVTELRLLMAATPPAMYSRGNIS